MITDRKKCRNKNLIPVVRKALQNGIRLIQIREKDLSLTELHSLSLKLKSLCKKYHAKILINSKIEIAQALDLDGVHLPHKQLSVSEALLLLGKGKLIGKSTHSLKEALKAQQEGAHFVTFGPIFETPSKKKLGKPVGMAELEKVCKKLRIPVFALGGLNLSHLPQVRSAGARGVAGIRTFIRDL